MDIKKLLLKLEDCKKDYQKKIYLSNICEQIIKYKNDKKYSIQLPTFSYDKTIQKLLANKDYDAFLTLTTTIIENIPSLAFNFRITYQHLILNVIMSIIPNSIEGIEKNFSYFLIATDDLENIDNIKYKENLIFYVFFRILLKKIKHKKAIDMLIKLKKYMTHYQYEIISYILGVITFQEKLKIDNDVSNQMLTFQKIIEFCSDYFSNDSNYIKNYDVLKFLFLMLLLLSPFKQEILAELYIKDKNLFLTFINDLVNYIKYNFKDNFILGNKCNEFLVDINNFFLVEEIDNENFFDINESNDFNCNINNKNKLINEYNNFIIDINLHDLLEKNIENIFDGFIWTLSSLLLKNNFNESSDKYLNQQFFDLFIPLNSLFKHANINHKKKFLCKYLELIKILLSNKNKIYEDWTYILDILKMCIDIITSKENKDPKNIYKKEIILLNEIFALIYEIYICDGLIYCDIELLSMLLHKCILLINKEIVLCFYINTYLKNEHVSQKNIPDQNNHSNQKYKNNSYLNFLRNLDKLVYNILSLPKKGFEITKNYLLEILKVNYLYDNRSNDYNKENLNSIQLKSSNISTNNIENIDENSSNSSLNFVDSSKQKRIEKVLKKYLENFFISFGKNENNYSYFLYMLTEILSMSRNVVFVKDIITTLIFINNDKIELKLLENFNEKLLCNLFENTINYSTKYVLSKEKLDMLINFLYDMDNMNDKKILGIAIKLLKSFTVNKYYEVLFINTSYSNNKMFSNINYNHKHSMIVIDYNYSKIHLYKKKFKDRKDFSLYHKANYAPFILFKHVKLFTALNHHLIENIQNKYIFESTLEFYFMCLDKNVYFLKGINLKEFLNIILKEKDLTKISLSKKSTWYLLKILNTLPYHLRTEMSLGGDEVRNMNRLKTGTNDEIQLILDPRYKNNCVNCLLNLWNSLNNSISNIIRKIFNNEQLDIFLFSKNPKNPETNKGPEEYKGKRKFSFLQLTNESYKENNTEENISNIFQSIMEENENYLWCGQLNIYNAFEYIYKCLKILKIYLISSVNDILFIKKNSLDYNYKNIEENIQFMQTNCQSAFLSIKNFLIKLFSQIINSINYKYFNPKYTLALLSLLFEIKELITLFIYSDSSNDSKNNNEYENENNGGLDFIFKTIFISMFLGWNNEELIIEKFDKYLNTNYKMKILDKEKFIILGKYYKEANNFDVGINKLIENISDNLNFYLMEYIPNNKTQILIDIINEIFPDHSNYREFLFYKMTEWTLKVKKKRDTLNIDYSNIYNLRYLNKLNHNTDEKYIGQKIFSDSQVFYGNNSIIVISPITESKCSFTVRNPISNMNLIIDSNIPIIKNNNIIESEKEFEEDEENEEDNEDSNNDKNKIDDNDDMISYTRNSATEFKRKINIDNFGNNNDKENIKKKEAKNNQNEKIQNTIIENNDDIGYNIINLQKEFHFKRHRFKSDLDTINSFSNKESMVLFSDQRNKMIENCIKIFSIIVELTDYKVENYKWIDLSKNDNLNSVTKLIQNLDLVPLYFCYDCGLIYYSSNISDNSKNNIKCLASYVYFMGKLGTLYDYYDFYPDKERKISSNKFNKKEKYIVINEDTLTRINFNIMNLTEKDKNKIIEENYINIIWIDNLNYYYDYNVNIFTKKLKVFFIISQISENFYKIQRKYNQFEKNEVLKVIDEIYANDLIINIDNQSSIQLLLNMITQIQILIKNYIAISEEDKLVVEVNGVDENLTLSHINSIDSENRLEKRESIRSIVLDNQNIIINDNYVPPSNNTINSERTKSINLTNANDENMSSFQKRFEIINSLCQG